MSKDAIDWSSITGMFAVSYRERDILYVDGYDDHEEAWSAFMRSGSNPEHSCVGFHNRPYHGAWRSAA